MRRWLLPLTLAALALTAGAARVEASPRDVGLGVAAGIAVPRDEGGAYDLTGNWGFYVDIPLLSTFHVTPSTLLYRLQRGGQGFAATDVSLSFKFMVPLGPLAAFAGVTAGLTSTDRLDPHVGLLGGAQLRILPNVDAFAQVNYRAVLRDDRNIRDVMVYAGPVFRF
jgi:hypothetical protein